MEITCTDGVLNIRKTGEDMVVTKKVEHPGDTLREIIEQYKNTGDGRTSTIYRPGW